VLVVDDEPAMLRALAEMVTDCGYQALTAGSWTEALRIYRHSRPAVVVLDVVMPGVDGYKLSRMFKSETAGFVPVILVTGLGDMESRRRGMAAGADDFLTKPVSPLELEIRLKSMLRIKQLTDELHGVNEKLARLAVTDPLTGLQNRRSLDDHLRREHDRARRYGGAFTVAILDIDHFKPINDTYGHTVGDQVLVRVSRELERRVRKTDVVGRWGGEEFLVLAPETPAEGALILGERLREAVAVAASREAGLPPVTASIGLASSDAAPEDGVDELILRADAALYEAKRRGRNRCVDARELDDPRNRANGA
jgi:two-component system, cell cycle response regulator